MWAQGPALPLREGKDKEQSVRQGLDQVLAPQARAEIWPVDGAEEKQAQGTDKF